MPTQMPANQRATRPPVREGNLEVISSRSLHRVMMINRWIQVASKLKNESCHFGSFLLRNQHSVALVASCNIAWLLSLQTARDAGAASLKASDLPKILKNICNIDCLPLGSCFEGFLVQDLGRFVHGGLCTCTTHAY